jgi:hypothetical protein
MHKEETMDAVETGGSRISAALPWTEQAEDLAVRSERWPQFGAPELRRLRFLAYRRARGKLRPSAPLHPAGVRVCAEVAAYLQTPAPRWPDTAAVGMPPLWRAWLDAHGPAQRAPSTRGL